MIKTVIVISQEREKISLALAGDKDIKIAAEGKDGYDALRLTSSFQPDIAILDNQLEFIAGGEIPPLIKIRSPSTSVVILADVISNYQLQRAAVNEVSGLIHKETEMDLIPEILKCIIRGGCYISPQLGARILRILSAVNRENQLRPQLNGDTAFLSKDDPAHYLSKTELRVLAHIAEGSSSEEIAQKLNLAVGTVRNYISSIMRKTGVRNRAQMTLFAFFHRLVRFDPDIAVSA